MKAVFLIHEYRSCRILLLVLAILFTLCIGSAHSASEPGTVTIVIPTEPENLDPGETARAMEGQLLMRNVVETLTEINPADSSIMPRLATSWKQIDAKTWRFFLRKGVKFQDGEDFNAEAAIFSINRILNKKLFSTTRANFFVGVNMEGKALDSHTLEIKTDRPEPLMLTLMNVLAICSPKTSLDKLTRSPIGTGPYKFVKWDAGTQIIFERFDGYWGKQPQVKRAVYLWRPDSAVRAAMVAIGEADFTPSISVGDANRADMDKSYLDSLTIGTRFSGRWEPPLNDRRVRMALNYAVDHNSFRGTILSKDVIPATQMIVPNIFGYNPDLKPWPYDKQKAKQLLDEARKDGVPVEKEILMVGRVGAYPNNDQVLEALMTMWRDIGLNVKLKMLEPGAFRPYGRKPYPPGPYLLDHYHDNNNGDAAFTVFNKYHCDGIQSPVCDKTLDDLIEKAQVAMGEERRKFWQAAFKRIHEEIISDVFLFHNVGYCRVGKRINFEPTLRTTVEIQLAHMTFKQ